jgi:crotonobetainyl-CoA:carnitine CoA-transferase CaiB-like acyl-CoA transferase
MQALEGLTVVALEQAVAAPLATRQLADLGARVIKIERPDGGDFARAYDTRARGLSSHFVWCNRGKLSLTLDLKQPAALALLHRLVIEQADVLVHNLAPGAATRLGLDAAALASRAPRLITCEISGYGRGGPMQDAVFATLDLTEVEARLDAARIAHARVNDLAGLWQHPQLAARERWTTMATPAGPMPTLLPPGMPAAEAPIAAVPALGEHTDGLLDSLGVDTQARAALRASRAI